MPNRPGEREVRKPIHEQTRPLFLHVTFIREQCACGLISEAGKFVVKDAETNQVVRCRGCADGKVTG